MRTPQRKDTITAEAEAILRRRALSTPLVGGQNVDEGGNEMGDSLSDATGKVSRNAIRTPNRIVDEAEKERIKREGVHGEVQKSPTDDTIRDTLTNRLEHFHDLAKVACTIDTILASQHPHTSSKHNSQCFTHLFAATCYALIHMPTQSPSETRK